MTAPDAVAALEPQLRAGALAMNLVLDDTQIARLLQHLALISRWNQVYNLTAVREPQQMLTQHVLDSLAAVTALRAQTGGRATSLLDVGSGAGLPGVAWAVACPELAVTCVDAVAKKAGFIRQVAAELQLPRFSAVHGRVETLPSKPWDVIASRAFASLADFAGCSAPLLAPEGVWLAMKGKVPHEEIAELPATIEVFHVERLEVPGLLAERCIVWMRKSRKNA